ncbi:MAG: 2-amino-4-hydroxy-6-hydroxymethyldihydropteridine diphosphokinase [Acetobacteraceae bacterium]|nr:2-amino-4-hydroxy-6-hydroxymethyldihydropteridine diphosphokinase [Acetobacteraceae bacterium]
MNPDAVAGPILVAVGSNLPDGEGRSPFEVCRRAAAALEGVVGLQVVAVSRWHRSAPVPPSGQPDFINGVVRLAGIVAPEVLLAALRGLEDAAGRWRGVANAARVLDLDIVAMGALVRAAPDPVLPHPRAHLRAFVMAPLAEVAPDWWHPLLQCSVQDLLVRVKDQAIGVICPPKDVI